MTRMFGLFGGKKAAKKSDFEIEDDHDEEQGELMVDAKVCVYMQEILTISVSCCVVVGTCAESEFLRSLQVNLSRLIAYCESAEVTLQREVAEKLANEAVKPARQVQIVQYGGLKLLVPLTKSTDTEVQRLAAHALANLSVNCKRTRSLFLSSVIQ